MNIDYSVTEWDFCIPEKAGVEVFACNIRRIINEAWIKEAVGFYVPEFVEEVLCARVRVCRNEEQEHHIRHTSVACIDAEVRLVVRAPSAFYEIWFMFSDYVEHCGQEEETVEKAELLKFSYDDPKEKFVVCRTGKADDPYVIYCDGQKHEYGEEIIGCFRAFQYAQLFAEMNIALDEGRRIF